MEFKKFAETVRTQFNSMAKTGDLFIVDVDKNELWDTYLNSFPEGTNNLFRERREYDCQHCKQFIRQAGNIVTIKNNKLVSIWDIKIDDATFQTVADALSSYIKTKDVDTVFVHTEKRIGLPFNTQETDNGNITWNHFSVDIPNSFIKRGDDIGSYVGKIRTTKDVLFRSLNELSIESAEIVLELIEQGTLYRGNEFKTAVKSFVTSKKKFDKIPESKRKIYCWKLKEYGIKNTVIGTLLDDISNGKELDEAVRLYESKVAPTNYKRPKALVTKKMIENAEKKCVELGIEPSLYTRCAVPEDITINNVIYADRGVQPSMSGGSAFDMLKQDVSDVPGTKNLNKIDTVSIDQFIETILPKATSIEMLLENKHENNLMTLLAPVNSDAPNILKWQNNFRWSYNGEVADSMKMRVKKAGGDVNGVLRYSIQWNDFDAHCYEPNGNKIYFRNKGSRHSSSGMLDVDIITPGRDVAVENITYSNMSKMPDGDYKFVVHNYSHNGGRTGFTAEIEFNGEIHAFEYNKELRNDEMVVVAVVKKTKAGFTIVKSLPSTVSTKEIYGISSNKFHKVTMIMNSPNHWDGEKTGNKHYFFTLDKCKTNDSIRGFYNEFLKDDLNEHRKVFEMLGSKLKAEPVDNQLSGLGFSSTKRDSVVVKVTGTFNRTIRVAF